MLRVTELIANTQIEPRPYQSRIVEKVWDMFLNRKMRSVLIESPTGSGKTVMGLMSAWGLQQELGLKVGWIAMRRNLLTQTAEEIDERGMNVKVEFISMFEKDPPKNLDLLVVDEAQHDAANSMAHLHSVIRPKFILGLSATPFRADKMKLCFDKVIRDAGIRQLIQEGFLSKFDHYTVPQHSPKAVANLYLSDRAKWGKSITYFHTLGQCEELQRLLEAAGVRSEVVTGSSDRDAQLAAFEKGDAEMLINCMVLAEGFDCPSLKTVFCRPSTKAVTVQMCGRVLRKFADLPVKQIVQCQQSPWPFTRTAEAVSQYAWEHGSWKSLTLNPMIERVSQNVLKALATQRVDLPEFVKKRQALARRHRRNEPSIV
ncbi:DEAD/DEAH box helicase [Zavarzinella formosa]|uniref:DEAD/DEAH box helicase n=1 Tax=Zavarzinella formosa TaxID=360055 RepID=UPI0002F95E44|nr:DEAD/DEAH box helicase family protein [Zavarzinella formosa]